MKNKCNSETDKKNYDRLGKQAPHQSTADKFTDIYELLSTAIWCKTDYHRKTQYRILKTELKPYESQPHRKQHCSLPHI